MKSVFLSPPRPRPSMEFLLTLYCGQRERERERERERDRDSGVALKVVGHRGWRGWSPEKWGRYASQRIEPLQERGKEERGRGKSPLQSTDPLAELPSIGSVNTRVTLGGQVGGKENGDRSTSQRVNAALGSFFSLDWIVDVDLDRLYFAPSILHSPADCTDCTWRGEARRVSPGRLTRCPNSNPIHLTAAQPLSVTRW